jgi:hypothetical protein
VQSIRPTEPLPAITDSVVIDGYSQFASEPTTRPVGNDAQLHIELDGVNAGSAATGLRIEADDVTVRGFIIYSNPPGDEGKKVLGQKAVTTNADGLANFTFAPSQAVLRGRGSPPRPRPRTPDATPQSSRPRGPWWPSRRSP